MVVGVVKGKVGKEEKGPKPTRALTSYIYYSNEQVPKIKAETGCSHQEAMKKCGEQWGSLTDKEKEPYAKMHDKDQTR